jgi:hypothetical protein
VPTAIGGARPQLAARATIGALPLDEAVVARVPRHARVRLDVATLAALPEALRAQTSLVGGGLLVGGGDLGSLQVELHEAPPGDYTVLAAWDGSALVPARDEAFPHGLLRVAPGIVAADAFLPPGSPDDEADPPGLGARLSADPRALGLVASGAALGLLFAALLLRGLVRRLGGRSEPSRSTPARSQPST